MDVIINVVDGSFYCHRCSLLLFGNQEMISVFLVFLWVTIATLADTFFKSAGTFNSRKFISGLLLYAVCAFFAIPVFRKQQFAWVVIIWNCLSLLLSMALSLWFYHEPFSLKRTIAVVLVFVAIFLTEL